MKTFYFVSLGCPKNRVDTEMAVAGMMNAGYTPADRPEDADIIVVNTCSFVTAAKSESIETLLEMAGHKKGRATRLVAMGCLGQEAADELAESMPEVDLVLGTGAVDRLPALLAEQARTFVADPTYLPATSVPRVLTQSPAFAYLKDGCSRKCAFCTIPSIKGPFASRPLQACLDEARQLADAGVRELVLVAQDLTQYGKPERRRLLPLLDGLEKVDGIEWVRLMYLYPEGITQPLLDRIAGGGKILPYLDMPLQHIDDRVLRTMRRGTSAASIRRILDRIRTAAPKVALRTTFIVGHPGEDAAAFDNLVRFVEEIRFDNLGVFAFSPEEGTVAATLPGQVPARTAERRRDRIMRLQQRISTRKNKARIGSRTKVLVEGPSPDHEWVLVGRTPGQAPEVDGIVYLDGYEGEAGDLVDVTITGASAYDLVAVADSPEE